MGKGQRQQQQSRQQQGSAQVVHAGLAVATVGQPHDSGEHHRGLRHVEPEYPPPARQFYDGPTVGRPQHGAGLGRSAHDAQGQCPALRGNQRDGQCHADGNRSTAADGLDDPRPDHPLEVGRDGHQAGADAEHYQRRLVDAGVAVDVAPAAR